MAFFRRVFREGRIRTISLGGVFGCSWNTALPSGFSVIRLLKPAWQQSRHVDTRATCLWQADFLCFFGLWFEFVQSIYQCPLLQDTSHEVWSQCRPRKDGSCVSGANGDALAANLLEASPEPLRPELGSLSGTVLRIPWK